jgi:hypothetical protein
MFGRKYRPAYWENFIATFPDDVDRDKDGITVDAINKILEPLGCVYEDVYIESFKMPELSGKITFDSPESKFQFILTYGGKI